MNLTKQEGFAGQVSIVLPESIRKELGKNPLTSSLYLTDIGYYPNAKRHYKERSNGANEAILIYVIDGNGVISVGGVEAPISANQFIIIPKGTPHFYMADEKSPWSIYWLHFKGKNSSVFAESHAQPETIAPSSVSRIDDRKQLFHEIIDVLTLGYSPDNLEYANLCLGYLLASFHYINQFRIINYATEKDIVQKATIYMKQNLEKILTLEELSAQFGLSASHFSRLFRRKTRYSPMHYFIQLKIQYACQLLDYSNLRIHEIANEIGYTDAYYFSRIFKKVMGTSPKIYRNKSKPLK